MRLRDVPPACFQGVVPAVLATCDAAGAPNVTYLSQVHFIDDGRVALSCQFFNKTKANVLENPFASVELLDPQTLDGYRLELRFDHAETSGRLFEQMSARIEAIASHTGMAGLFKLLSADVYEVLAVEPVELLDPPPPAHELPPLEVPTLHRGELTGLQMVAQRVCRARDLEGLLAGLLEALDEAFGFSHSMVFLADETGERLDAVASRGYGPGGIGADVAVGEGLIGTVARERCVLRVAGVGAGLRYGQAIRASVHRAGGRVFAPEVPLPGLVDAQSQLALPLVAGDRLVGVLAVESTEMTAFEAWHEAYLDIIASQVGLAIENMVQRGREAEVDTPAPPSVAPPAPHRRRRRFRYFADDGCVFVDDEYLVRNVPGKILWRLLRAHAASGRTEFTNRELRLDATLGLPALRDNLESRLVLLRKRLQEKCPDLALVPTGRGQFHLEIACAIELCEAEAP